MHLKKSHEVTNIEQAQARMAGMEEVSTLPTKVRLAFVKAWLMTGNSFESVTHLSAWLRTYSEYHDAPAVSPRNWFQRDLPLLRKQHQEQVSEQCRALSPGGFFLLS